MAALENVRRFTTGLQALAVVVSFFVFIGPDPYRALATSSLTALCLIACVGLFAWQRFYPLDDYRNSVRPTLVRTFLVTGFVLGVRTLRDVNLVEVSALWLLALAVGFALGVPIGRQDRFLSVVGIVLISVGATVPAFALLAHANVLFDRTTPQVFKTVVMGKRKSSFRMLSYHLDLRPWPAGPEVNDVSVPSSVYDSVAGRDPVCVDFYAGALRVPWYAVRRCD